jgi:hypothetical protein
VINWVAINPVLISVFTDIARDKTKNFVAFTAEWKEGPRSFVHPEQGFSLLLKVTNVSAFSIEDEVLRDVVLGELVETIVGQRKFVLQLQVIFPEHTDERWAFAVTERIRTRLRRSRIIDALYAVNVSIVSIGNSIKVSFLDRGRVVSAATMDITCATVAIDTDDQSGGWIDYVVLDSHYQETAGVDLPNPALNYTDLEIPPIP